MSPTVIGVWVLANLAALVVLVAAIVKLGKDLRAHKGAAALRADLVPIAQGVLQLLPPKDQALIKDFIARATAAPAKPGKQAGYATRGAIFLALLGSLALLGAAPRPARAGLSTGISVAAVKFYPTRHLLTQIAAGAGYQVQYGFMPRVIHGVSFDLLGVEGAVYLTHSDGITTASLAALLCTMSGLLCVGGGPDLYVSQGQRGWALYLSGGYGLSMASSFLPAGSSPASTPVFGATAPPAAPPAGNHALLPF